MTRVQRAYKFSFNPTPEQEKQLVQDFGNTRVVWNLALDFRNKTYEHYCAEEKRLNPEWVRPPAPKKPKNAKNKKVKVSLKDKSLKTRVDPPILPTVPKYVSMKELSRLLTLLKKTPEYAWLNLSPSTVFTQKLKDLDDAHARFYKQLCAFPKFKKRRWEQSVRYQIDQRLVQNLWIPGQKLQLPFLGELNLVWSKIPLGIPKMATVKQTADGKYWVTVSVEEEVAAFPKTGQMAGFDWGLSAITTDHLGNKVAPLKAWFKNLENLKKSQKSLSQKTKGSNNYHKERKKVAKFQAKTKNQRQDFTHKLTTGMVRDYDVIFIEDLDIQGLMKKRQWSARIADSNPGELVRQLHYKSDFYEKKLVKIDRFEPTTKKCSSCGQIHPMKLSDRRMICGCGLNLDRDHNAALNIYRAGLALHVASSLPTPEIAI